MPAGLLALRKPGGPTSAAVAERVRRLIGQRRVGHSGTLDPAADGVLVMAYGSATGLFPYLLPDKTYRAVIRLGATTSTGDACGETLTAAGVPSLNVEQITATLAQWEGPQLQIPPMVSARRHKGERLYEIARRGESVLRPPRRVQIHRLRLLEWQPPDASLEVHCSTGTYIRSLAAELGMVWGCGAHLLRLTRTACNGFTWEQAADWDAFQIAAAAGNWRRYAVEPAQALAHLPSVTVDEAGCAAVAHGRPLPAPDSLVAENGPVRVLDQAGRLLAVARPADGQLLMARVLASPAG
ncbi:MAG: tRNA pseudouridine(55) synthase TruB [candidate division FCPU426 bacterium]